MPNFKTITLAVISFMRSRITLPPSSLLLLSIALLSLSGCGSDPRSSGSTSSALPTWVMTPPMGCASGSLADQGSPHLTRIGAVTRARAELSRQIKVRVESVLSLYQEVSELEGRVDARDELMSRSIQSTRAQLEGTRVQDTATDRGTLYALVCVERARALRVLNEVKRRVKVLAPRRASTAPDTSSGSHAASGSERSDLSSVRALDNIKRDQRGKRNKREALRARAESALRELEAHLGSSQ